MPLVKIKYRSPITKEMVHELAPQLQIIVADALNCENPDGHLTSNDIEVEVKTTWWAPLTPTAEFDLTSYNLNVEVEANDYPERRANLAERLEKILEAVREILRTHPDHTEHLPRGFVWVKLFPASFGEI